MMRNLLLALLTLIAAPALARDPIIDMHLHASSVDEQGPPPLSFCAPLDPMPTWDGKTPWAEALVDYFKHPRCKNPIVSPTEQAEEQRRTLAEMARYNVIGVVSGPVDRLREWRMAAPGRILFGIDPPSYDELADAAVLTKRVAPLKASGDAAVIGEIAVQYAGMAPDDKRLDGLWTTAEALDLPVGLHVGPGAPGTPYLPGMGYRARMSNPLALEEVLVKHPKLRLYVMHAGYPMLDAMLALMYAHPQVYVDTGVIAWTQPRAAFYRYLRALVEAGFGNRIMFGSDQMIWPEAIGRSIDAIEEAPFLTRAQKRAILYDNAARFLRLDAATIARHRAMQGISSDAPRPLARRGSR
jgi:predicted TIM-barrel fold metal-dependent hydrolase